MFVWFIEPNVYSKGARQMKLKSLAIVIGCAAIFLAAGVIHSQEPAPKHTIDPKADALLRQMSERMKGVNASIFRLTDTIDEVQENGQKIQYAHVREMTVQRPDKLKVETTGDVANRTVWKSGKTLTVLDRDKNVYAQVETPESIGEAVDALQEKYGMSLPAADLLSTDVYKTMMENCRQLDYIGLGYVEEEKCHHLAFTGDNVDWQLWISAGDSPGPRKIVITYKNQPGQPQYTMQLLSLKNPASIQETTFTSEIPKDAEKIEFQPRAGRQ